MRRRKNEPEVTDWSRLPSEFVYLKETAEKYGSQSLNPEVCTAMINRLEPQEWASLAAVYEQARHRGDGLRLSTWIDNFPKQPRRPWLQECHWPVFGLLCLFEELGRRGIPPFNDGSVRYDSPLPALDWTKLPDNLHYLCAPAERYGVEQVEDANDEPIRAMTSESRAELAKLAERIRVAGHAGDIGDWLDSYPPDVHPEASLVYWLCATLNALQLEW